MAVGHLFIILFFSWKCNGHSKLILELHVEIRLAAVWANPYKIQITCTTRSSQLPVVLIQFLLLSQSQNAQACYWKWSTGVSFAARQCQTLGNRNGNLLIFLTLSIPVHITASKESFKLLLHSFSRVFINFPTPLVCSTVDAVELNQFLIYSCSTADVSALSESIQPMLGMH